MNIIEKAIITFPEKIEHYQLQFVKQYFQEINRLIDFVKLVIVLSFYALFIKMLFIAKKNVYANLFVETALILATVYILFTYLIFRYFLRPLYKYEHVLYLLISSSLLSYGIHSRELYDPRFTSSVAAIVLFAAAAATIYFEHRKFRVLVYNICFSIIFIPFLFKDLDYIYLSSNNALLVVNIFGTFFYIGSLFYFLDRKYKQIKGVGASEEWLHFFQDIVENKDDEKEEVFALMDELKKTKKYRYLLLAFVLDLVHHDTIKTQTDLSKHFEREHALLFKGIKNVQHLVSDKFSRHIISGEIMKKYFVNVFLDVKTYTLEPTENAIKLAELCKKYGINDADDIYLKGEDLFLDKLFFNIKKELMK